MDQPGDALRGCQDPKIDLALMAPFFLCQDGVGTHAVNALSELEMMVDKDKKSPLKTLHTNVSTALPERLQKSPVAPPLCRPHTIKKDRFETRLLPAGVGQRRCEGLPPMV